MSDQLWSWILTAVGLTGFILAGKKVWWCWYINIACQALWFVYAIVTEQWGFIVAAAAYTFVFTKNAIFWTKEHQQKKWDEKEGWDFNEYTHLQEQIRDGDISVNDARRQRGLPPADPNRYCPGFLPSSGYHGPAHMSCPRPDMPHLPHLVN